jgi:hypothetical protein
MGSVREAFAWDVNVKFENATDDFHVMNFLVKSESKRDTIHRAPTVQKLMALV